MSYSLFGIVFIVAGIGLHLWRQRQRFYRRNAAGVEEFASFGGAILARMLEGAVGLIAFLFLLIGIGLFLGMGALISGHRPSPHRFVGHKPGHAANLAPFVRSNRFLMVQYGCYAT